MPTLYKQARQASERINELVAKRDEIFNLISEENEVRTALQNRLAENYENFAEQADCHKQLSELSERSQELQQMISSIDLEINKAKLTAEVEPKTPLSELMTSQEKLQSRLAPPSQSKIAMQKLQDRVNRDLGDNWWKKYISAAFWSNLSTPINVCITFFTALTTGQTATSNLLSSQSVIGLGLATLILSILNTFFTPHKKMVSLIEEMNKWQELGSQFESVYYSNNFDDDDFERRFKAYEEIQKGIHQLKIKQQTTDADFLTDLIYLCAVKTCLKRERWIKEPQALTNETTV